jgi:hypothetical protein
VAASKAIHPKAEECEMLYSLANCYELTSPNGVVPESLYLQLAVKYVFTMVRLKRTNPFD